MSQNLLNSSFILSGPPDPVTGCQVKNKTFTTISIGCRQGYDGGLKQYFVAILCPYHTFSEVLEDTKESNLVLPDKLKCKREIGSQRNFNEPSFLFDHLPHGSQFSLAIFAQNIKVRTYSFNTILSFPRFSKHTRNGIRDFRPEISAGFLVGNCGIQVVY